MMDKNTFNVRINTLLSRCDEFIKHYNLELLKPIEKRDFSKYNDDYFTFTCDNTTPIEIEHMFEALGYEQNGDNYIEKSGLWYRFYVTNSHTMIFTMIIDIMNFTIEIFVYNWDIISL